MKEPKAKAVKEVLKRHMLKGKDAHPDPDGRRLRAGGRVGGMTTRGNGAAVRGIKARGPLA